MVVEQVGEIVLGSGNRRLWKGIVKLLERQGVPLCGQQLQLRPGQGVLSAYFGEQRLDLPGEQV